MIPEFHYSWMDCRGKVTITVSITLTYLPQAFVTAGRVTLRTSQLVVITDSTVILMYIGQTLYYNIHTYQALARQTLVIPFIGYLQ